MTHYKEIEEYRKFTTPQELHKSLFTLKGILSGISSDKSISQDEINELANWCYTHENLKSRHPFNELIPMIDNACEDGIITDDESADIIWLCDNFIKNADIYYDSITSSLQYLSGIIHGILADNHISDSEILALKTWISEHEDLSGNYPFDEIESLLMSVLMDGKITDEERDILKAFLGEFVDTSVSFNIDQRELDDLRKQYCVSGICAVCQDIEFENELFCFTGKSKRAKRDEIANLIKLHGGKFSNNITKSTRYLIVGIDGNPCWAYSCYGRKIEQAMNLRKEGQQLTIVSEIDFWDILDDM